MVVLFHFICATIGFVESDHIRAFFGYGAFGVHIFFVISGFIIPYSMHSAGYQLKNWYKFILKRIVRLDPPYIVSILLVLAVAFLKIRLHYADAEPLAISGKQIALHLGYLINFFPAYKWLNNVYWTLAIEFQYYLLMSVMIVLFVSKKLPLRLVAYLLFFAAPYLLLLANPSGAHFPAYAPLFLMGILVFQVKSTIISKAEFWIVFALSAVLVYLTQGQIVFFGLFAALVILFFENLRIPALSWLGRFSYSVYLIHPVIGAAVINILSHHAVGMWQKTGVLLAGMAVTLGSSLLLYWLVERPSKKLSSKIKF